MIGPVEEAPGGGREATGGPEGAAPWRRLSPRMLLIHPVQEVVRMAPALLGLLIAGSSSGNPGMVWSLCGVAAVVLYGVLRWFTTTYRLTPEHVRLRKGVVLRKVLTVPRDRIRTVDITSPPLHRMLGLARVEIGTGRSGISAGLTLDSLSAEEAARLRVELLHRRGTARGETRPAAGAAPTVATGPAAESGQTVATAPAPQTGPPAGEAASSPGPGETLLAELRPGWVRFAPFTMSGLVAIGVFATFVWRLFSEWGVDVRRVGPVREGWHWFSGLGLTSQLVIGVPAFVVIVAIASTFGYLFAFWRFRLTRHDGTLHVTRGLLTNRATTIEERRLRGVRISEFLTLRAVGGATLTAVTTGLNQGSQRSGALLPPAPRAEAERVAALVIDGKAQAASRSGPPGPAAAGPSPVTAPLARHGRAACRRRFTRAFGAHGLALAGLAVLWHTEVLPLWPLIAGVALLPVTALLAVDRYRSLGHTLVRGYLVTRSGSIRRQRVVLECDGIIGWTIRRSLFQRRAGLCTLTATTAAGDQSYAVPDVELGEALRLIGEASPGLLDPFLRYGAAVPGPRNGAAPQRPVDGTGGEAGTAAPGNATAGPGDGRGAGDGPP